MGNETNHAVDSKFAVAEGYNKDFDCLQVRWFCGCICKTYNENLALEALSGIYDQGMNNLDINDLKLTDRHQSGTDGHELSMIKAGEVSEIGNLGNWLYGDHGA